MDDPSAIAQSAVERSYRPRIVVYPLVPAEAGTCNWLRTGISEEIVNGLSRIGRLDVIARHSSFAASPASPAEAAAAFDAGRVVTSRVEAEDGVVTVTLDLYDHAGAPVETLVRRAALAELQDVRDALVADLIGRIGFSGASPLSDGRVAPVVAPETYLSLLRALQSLWSFDRAGHEAATAVVDDALNRDPTCAPARALRGFLAARAFRSGWAADRDEAVRHASLACDAAANGARRDPLVLWTTAFCEAMLFRRYPEASDLVELAHVLDPRASHVLTWGSLFLSYNLEFDMAMAYAHRSFACSPSDPMSVTQGFAGALAAVHAQNFQAALLFCDRVLASAPKMPNVLRIRAVACERLGRRGEAREAVAAVRALDPQETIALIARVNPLREWPDFGRFLDALRAAGMPEGGDDGCLPPAASPHADPPGRAVGPR